MDSNFFKGKVGEMLMISKFLEKNFEVFDEMVDINGVDFIAIPTNKKFRNRFLKIQVKAVPELKKAFRIPKKPTLVDFYCFIAIDTEDFWIAPFSHIKKLSNTIKSKKGIQDLMFYLKPEKYKNFYQFNVIKNIIKGQNLPFHAARTGKVGEKIGFAYLLKNNIDVHETLCDEKAIDAVIKYKKHFYDLQIKYSSDGFSFRNVRKISPRNDYLFLFVNGVERKFFIIPSHVVWKHSSGSGNICLSRKLQEKYSGIKFLSKQSYGG